MFRPMRRASRAIPEEAAKHLLQQSRRGVLAVNGDNGYPFAIPVNYYYDQEHDKIYFHGAKSGQKVDALKQNDKVCFTVYGNEHFEPGDWAPYVQSTVVFGRCRLIDDAAATEARVRELGMKYYPGKEEVEKEIALDIKAVQLGGLPGAPGRVMVAKSVQVNKEELEVLRKLRDRGIEVYAQMTPENERVGFDAIERKVTQS